MLHVNNLAFSYSNTPVLQDISFTVKPGENIAIVGESGSGKSTLLKLLYGTYDLDKGSIAWKDTPILGPKYNLVVGYDFMKHVAQEFNLMPYITVAENIGKFLSNFYPKAKKARTAELITLVELSEFTNTKVQFLSGGQKQRVALAQAIAKQPEIILLDEPFSHIDSFKTQSLRRNIFKFLKRENISCIVATHDKDDVLGFADRLLILDQGEIVANNTPNYLYQHPNNALTASFFGNFNLINDQYVYAHQLKVVKKSKLKATVLQSYFKGSHFLIEAKRDQDIVFFNHQTSIPPNTCVFLQIVT